MEKNIAVRPPIVVVLGHVDHGKTSLLDYIRKTSVTKKEAGGITQSIGASVTKTHDGKDITFIDTPGHALFSAMRSRGVNFADIAILVVAADDGVQPQTLEAVKLLQESKIPFIVAITKIDLVTANVENVLQQLEKERVYFEKRGGDISYIGVSSKTGSGINELLDLISLVSELTGTKGNAEGLLEGYVLETAKDKRGLLSSLVIKNGKIKVGDIIFASSVKAKIKGLFDAEQKPVKEISAGYPAQILGFSDLPEVGSRITSKPVEKPIPLRQDFAGRAELKIKIYLKARTAGSLEALLANIPAGVQVIGSGVGDLIESDIFLAKAAGAEIFLFEAKFASLIRKLAEMEGVKIERFEIVYDLIERLKELLDVDKEIILGEAQIIASFPFDKRKVAGVKVSQGKIKKSDKLKLTRNTKDVGFVKIISLRKQKDEVPELKQGEEGGILFEPQLDFQIADMLLSVSNK